MKFSNMKNKVMLVTVVIASMAGTISHAAGERLECGREIGTSLAYCLFRYDDNLTFFNYIEQWRNIVQKYRPHFDQKVIAAAMKALDDIEAHIKLRCAQKKRVDPTEVATILVSLVECLPADVKKQYRETFEQIQLKLLKRNKPLSFFELVGPLSKRLNKSK